MPLIDQFKRFHERNPHVWELFKRFAFDGIRAGRSNFSSRTIIERIRWELTVTTERVGRFKIANAMSPFYGRLFDSTFPEHRGFFRHATSVADLADLKAAS